MPKGTKKKHSFFHSSLIEIKNYCFKSNTYFFINFRLQYLTKLAYIKNVHFIKNTFKYWWKDF